MARLNSTELAEITTSLHAVANICNIASSVALSHQEFLIATQVRDMEEAAKKMIVDLELMNG